MPVPREFPREGEEKPALCEEESCSPEGFSTELELL